MTRQSGGSHDEPLTIPNEYGPAAGETIPLPDVTRPETVMLLKGAYASAYEAIVRPSRVWAISRYFLERWVPTCNWRPALEGVIRQDSGNGAGQFSWLVVLFRQIVVWNARRASGAGAAPAGEQSFAIDLGYLERESGLDRKTILKILDLPLARFFFRRDSGRDRRAAQRAAGQSVPVTNLPNRYFVQMDDPFTPPDAQALAQALASAQPTVKDPMERALQRLRHALSLPVSQLLADDLSGMVDPSYLAAPLTTLQLLERVEPGLSRIPDSDERWVECLQACDNLTAYILAPEERVYGTYYFRRHQVPRIGYAAAWAVVRFQQACWDPGNRGQSRADPASGAPRRIVVLPHLEWLGQQLGVSSRTARGWLHHGFGGYASIAADETDPQTGALIPGRRKGGFSPREGVSLAPGLPLGIQQMSYRLKVVMRDPLIPEHRLDYERRLKAQLAEARNPGQDEAPGTISTLTSGASDITSTGTGESPDITSTMLGEASDTISTMPTGAPDSTSTDLLPLLPLTSCQQFPGTESESPESKRLQNHPNPYSSSPSSVPLSENLDGEGEGFWLESEFTDFLNRCRIQSAHQQALAALGPPAIPIFIAVYLPLALDPVVKYPARLAATNLHAGKYSRAMAMEPWISLALAGPRAVAALMVWLQEPEWVGVEPFAAAAGLEGDVFREVDSSLHNLDGGAMKRCVTRVEAQLALGETVRLLRAEVRSAQDTAEPTELEPETAAPGENDPRPEGASAPVVLPAAPDTPVPVRMSAGRAWNQGYSDLGWRLGIPGLREQAAGKQAAAWFDEAFLVGYRPGVFELGVVGLQGANGRQWNSCLALLQDILSEITRRPHTIALVDRPRKPAPPLPQFPETAGEWTLPLVDIQRQALSDLSMELPPMTFRNWLGQAAFTGCDVAGERQVYQLRVDTPYKADWVRARLTAAIKRTLSTITGCPVELLVEGP